MNLQNPAPGHMACGMCQQVYPVEQIYNVQNTWFICQRCYPQFYQSMQQTQQVYVWRGGNTVVAYKGQQLPDRCVKCNSTTVAKRYYKQVAWHPPWIFLLICAGVLVYAIVAIIIRENARISFCLCPEHRKRRMIHHGVAWSLLALSILLIVAAIPLESGPAALAGIAAMLASAVYAAAFGNTLVPKKIDKSCVWLGGCGESFLASLSQPATDGGVNSNIPH